MFRLLLALWLAAGVIGQGAQVDYEALGRKAVDAERSGDFRTAISIFNQLLRSGVDNPELRSNLGLAYYQAGDFAGAVRELQVALRSDPNSLPGNLFTGLSLLKVHKPTAALPFLERAHKARPDAPAPVLALAQAEIECNRISRAQALYMEATRLDPQNAEAWYGLGITDRALAEPEVKRALELKASGAAAPSVVNANARKLLDASQQALNRAMELDPQALQAHMLLGESFRIAERYGEAIREYSLATEEAPNLAAAWGGLAAAYSAAANDDEAQKAAKRALDLDPNDAQTNAVMAATLLREGDYAGAEPYARRALQAEPTQASAHLVLAKIYLAKNDRARALPELRIAAKDDTDGNVYYLLAATLRQLGKPEEAAAALQKYKLLHAEHVAVMK